MQRRCTVRLRVPVERWDRAEVRGAFARAPVCVPETPNESRYLRRGPVRRRLGASPHFLSGQLMALAAPRLASAERVR